MNDRGYLWWVCAWQGACMAGGVHGWGVLGGGGGSFNLFKPRMAEREMLLKLLFPLQNVQKQVLDLLVWFRFVCIYTNLDMNKMKF